MDSQHHRLEASTRGNALNGHPSLHCGTRHILYHTTLCQSGGQFVPWARCYRPETICNYWQDPSGSGIVRQFAQANKWILVGDYTALDTMQTETHLTLKREEEEKKLHRMAKVHDVWEMWQGSQNLHAIQKESSTQNKQMTAVGYISDTEEINKALWSHFQHDGVAAWKLSEISPLPPAVSAKDLPRGQTEVFNVRQINKSTVIQSNLIRTVHLNAFPSPTIWLAAMVTWIYKPQVMTTARQPTDPIWSVTMPARLQNTQSTGMWLPHQIVPDWFSKCGG